VEPIIECESDSVDPTLVFLLALTVLLLPPPSLADGKSGG
jgi:hypothetical protein